MTEGILKPKTTRDDSSSKSGDVDPEDKEKEALLAELPGILNKVTRHISYLRYKP